MDCFKRRLQNWTNFSKEYATLELSKTAKPSLTLDPAWECSPLLKLSMDTHSQYSPEEKFLKNCPCYLVSSYHNLSSLTSIKIWILEMISVRKGLSLNSELSIKSMRSRRPDEKLEFAGNRTFLEPLCTARATLSPRSYTASYGEW
jgi:hypothetical protein